MSGEDWGSFVRVGSVNINGEAAIAPLVSSPLVPPTLSINAVLATGSPLNMFETPDPACCKAPKPDAVAGGAIEVTKGTLAMLEAPNNGDAAAALGAATRGDAAILDIAPVPNAVPAEAADGTAVETVDTGAALATPAA